MSLISNITDLITCCFLFGGVITQTESYQHAKSSRHFIEITILLFFVCLLPQNFFRVKKVTAVRQEKTEYSIKERSSLAKPLTPVHRALLEQFATVLPRMLYNSVMAALGCQWLLLEKGTWLLTQAATVWIF